MIECEEMKTETTPLGDIAGRRVTILGAARSGVAAARLLQSRGARVFVSDNGPEEKLRESIAGLRNAAIGFETGGHSQRALEADLVVISPGVPGGSAIVREAVARGIPVRSELEVASWFCPAPIIAITGTNGKTTTTALAGRMFGDMHRRHIVAGNIGTAFSSEVSGLDEHGVAILEVSSFQLEHIETFHPRVSVILNITPDHLDRYNGSMDLYIAAKQRIFERQGEGDILVYNEDDPVTRRAVAAAPAGVTILPFGVGRRPGEGAFVENGLLVTIVRGTRSEIIPAREISIRGVHNLMNAMAAVLAALSLGIPPASLRATLRNFKGVEHRLEFVRTVGGVAYVNDSKATNVDSVWYALQSFESPIILLLGGRDKGNDYSKLTDLVRRHVKHIIAIGESAEKVVRAFTGVVPVDTASSMEAAVKGAASAASAGDVVLLSPACASFDWFRNYEHRGQVFKEIVSGL